MKKKALNITYIGIFVNVFLALIKISAGIIFSSQALIADGVHTVSDLLSDFVTVFGILSSEKPTDETHHYGHKKYGDLCEIIIGILLIITGISIFYSSGRKIFFHELRELNIITVFVALISILFKEWIYKKTMRVGKDLNSSLIISNAIHHRSDSFSSIAVAAGLTGAYLYKPLSVLDPLLGTAVAFIIIKSGFQILLESFQRIVDAAPPKSVIDAVTELIVSEPEIQNFHNLRMRYVGSEIFLDFHIMLDGKIDLYDAHSISKKLKHKIIDNLSDIKEVLIHIEPYEKPEN